MALFGFKFKKKKGETATAPSEPASKLARVAPPPEAPGRTETPRTASGASHGWYSFRVARHADKPTIKRAVEGRYGVRVLRVRVVNRQPRPIRLGRTEGSVPGYKNAMVKLREGEAIEFS